jgi:hypothetical protein
MEIFEKAQELENSQEFKLVSKAESIKQTIAIFSANYSELKLHFEKHPDLRDNKTFSLQRTPQGKFELEVYLAELSRLIHNYATSTQTLVSHQRKLVSNLFGSVQNFLGYKEEIDRRFTENLIHNFIQDLRNCILHVGLPPITSVRKFETISHNYSISLAVKKDSLLTLDCWSVKSRAYINSLEHQVDLEEICETYHSNVIDFQVWFEKAIRGHFSREFEFVGILSTEIRKLGIEAVFTFIRNNRAATRAMIEDSFPRFMDFNDVRRYYEAKEDKEKFKILVDAIQKYAPIPSEIYFLIFPLFEKLFNSQQ